MSFGNVMKELVVNEIYFVIDCSCGVMDVVLFFSGVVRKRRVGVL